MEKAKSCQSKSSSSPLKAYVLSGYPLGHEGLVQIVPSIKKIYKKTTKKIAETICGQSGSTFCLSNLRGFVGIVRFLGCTTPDDMDKLYSKMRNIKYLLNQYFLVS